MLIRIVWDMLSLHVTQSPPAMRNLHVEAEPARGGWELLKKLVHHQSLANHVTPSAAVFGVADRYFRPSPLARDRYIRRASWASPRSARQIPGHRRRQLQPHIPELVA